MNKTIYPDLVRLFEREGMQMVLTGLDKPSGYDTHEVFFGTRYVQGGRVVFSIDLSLPQLVQMVPRPDPERPLEGNRKVNLGRARAFSEYLRTHEDAVFPPLLLQAPSGEFDFDSQLEVGGTEFGYIKIPKISRGVVRILDGQHRSLGSHIAWEDIEGDIRGARENVARARRLSEQDLVAHHERELERLLRQRDRVARERVAIDVVIVDDPDEAKQIFVDIAENAKGITRDLTAMFDQRKVVNRVMQEVIKHPLLLDRVDDGKAGRLGKNSPMLIGAKNIVDIVRHLQVGEGRVGRKVEADLASRERAVVAETLRFIDLLVRAFPELGAIEKSEMTPQALRESSVLGSSTMLRALANVHHALTDAEGDFRWSTEEVESFFKKLAAHTRAPLDAVWVQTSVFPEGSMAPAARSQDMRRLVAEVTRWAVEGLPVIRPDVID